MHDQYLQSAVHLSIPKGIVKSFELQSTQEECLCCSQCWLGMSLTPYLVF